MRWTVVAFALVRVGEFDIRVDAEHLQKTVQVFGIGNFTVWALWFTFAVGVRYWAKIPFEWRLAIIEVALCVIFQAAFALWLLRFFAASEVSGIGVVFKAVFAGFVVIVGAIGGAISGIFYCGAWALASVALKRRRQVVEEEE